MSFPDALRTAAACALLAGSLLCAPASAQVVVEDPIMIERTVAEYIETAKRWSDTYNHYRQQISHYQQQLIKLKRLNFRMAQMADNFPERDVFYGVEQTCPGPSGLRDGLGEMIRAMLPNMDDDILTQQRMVCMRIVQAENSRYNETARMLKRMVQHQRDYQTGIETQRASVGESQGALAANDNETSRFIARMQMDREYWVARDRAWGTYIETLRRDHGRLAKRALEGNKDESLPILGKLVEAAALKAALEAGR